MDLSITITGAMLGGALIERKARREKEEARLAKFDLHIATCAEKNTAIALMHQKVEALARQAHEDSRQREWLGDCVVAIGAKMEVRLPERP